jgi:peroxiredoxin
VIAVGFDPPEETAAWAADEAYPFELWTDASRELALRFQAADRVDQSHPSRVTVLLDPQGDVVLRYDVGLNLGTHPSDVLDDAKILFPVP